MNVIIMNGDMRLSPPLKREVAEERLEQLKMIYPNAYLVDTDEAEIVQSISKELEVEEVENKGCAGGACTL